MTAANEYQLITFDPGAAATGWVHMVVDKHAFSRPENKVLHNIKYWEYGQFSGPEIIQLKEATKLFQFALERTSYMSIDVVSEDFELTQLIGGKNLLSPVRINAVLNWECHRRALKFSLQSRQLRTSVTRQRLALWGFDKKWRKDEFAAMQHAITWLRRIKNVSKERPWKLGTASQLNTHWDCACQHRKKCDLVHP